MSFNLQSKRCHICGRRAEGGTEEASKNLFTPMTLQRPVFGQPEFVDVCSPNSAEDRPCWDAATKQGYKIDFRRKVTR
jgi:hypothetical protein